MTDDTTSPAQGAKPHEPSQVNLRAELSNEIATAQSVLTAQLADLEAAGDSALLTELRGQLKILNALSETLSHAKGGTLAQIRAEVATSVAAARSIAGQAQASTATAKAHEAELAELETARQEARKASDDFMRDYYEKRIFDAYLHFDSAEDERAYRKREAARQSAINAAQAEGTPEGELLASKLSLEQLDDAGAHGADKSPEFRGFHDRLKSSGNTLKTALKASTPANTVKPADVTAQTEQSLSGPVDPLIVAALREAGVAIADQEQHGHGVAAGASGSRSNSRA